MSRLTYLLLLVFWGASIDAQAQGSAFRGYGEIQIAYYDHPDFLYRDASGRPPRDRRAAMDLSNFAFEMTHPLGDGLVAEFEVTIKHQGVEGSDEPNYLGPFNEDHQGAASEGAVELSKLLLARRFGESLSIYGGKIPVAFGLLSFTDTPMDYLGTRPFEAEVGLIPYEWSELGLAASFEGSTVTSTTEVVSGLDSIGINSYHFAAGAKQGRYGAERITEPALVERLDIVIGGGAKAGASVYYGETSQNRPTADMARACEDEGRVAACGYVHAPLTLVDAHGTLTTPRLRGSFLAFWGQLKNAHTVNIRNEINRSNLPALYSPAPERIYSTALELGVNTSDAPVRLEPFIRLERYDSMFRAASEADRNGLSSRSVVTLGTSWRPAGTYYAKADVSRRHYLIGGAYESTATVCAGFRF